MTEEQYEQASRLNYDIGLRENHIEEINKVIKSLKEKEGQNCTCEINLLSGYQFVNFNLYPLSKKIIEVIAEQLTDRKEEYQKEIKELKEKFRKL